MSIPGDGLHQLLIVYAAYVVAVASPGPSVLAIMGVAMRQGRVPALTLAAGVMTGSVFWASSAALGLSTLLASYASALQIIKVAGGLYLLFLAFKAIRSALRPDSPTPEGEAAPARESNGALYRRGLMLHLANPKAVLAWIAIMAIGLKPDSPAYILPAILVGCGVLGTSICCGYAILFSTRRAVRLYQSARRWIEGTMALFFGGAALRLLAFRV
ncbi:LysE family translocator [Inquilinus sp. CAU 1745]|uniref:LysE family translocator n=1 Tax=Inquilinus sp. CAU 1745 TaxID=3140369 RepID=UPI00325BE298